MKQIYLGTLTKPHGLKGSVFFHMENPADSQVRAGKQVYLTINSEIKTFIVEKIQTQGKRPILKLEGINSREELEPLLPAEVSMDREDFEELEEGQFYLSDLIGFTVLDPDSEKKLGVVKEFYSNGAQEIIVVEGESEWDAPVEFIKEVLWEERIVKIAMPEYL